MRSGSAVSTILVVDDQSAIREVLRRVLETAGSYGVAEASSVKEAMSIIDKSPPHAVILDISMPGGPGLGVIRELHRRGSETKILVLTSHTEMKTEALGVGAHAFLPKTAPSKQVLAALAGLLST